MAGSQPTPRAVQPPPEVPNLGTDQNTLSQYLRVFSQWCRNSFASKQDISTAAPQIMLQTDDVPPAVFQLKVTSEPTITLTPVALGSGQLGTPVEIATAADLNGYLPLSGGMVSGPLTVTGVLAGNIVVYSLNGNFISRALAGGNAQILFQDSTATAKGYCYWEGATNALRLLNTTGGGQAYVSADTNFYTNANIRAGSGYSSKQGTAGGAWGNIHNWWWTSAAIQAWVDGTNIGNISIVSDYRIKRDVEPLSSTWDQVKALNPVRYAHQDFYATGAKADAEPLVADDDKERWGFIAHELQETLIEDAATGHKDEENLLQSPNPWTVIAALTRTVQELQTRLETLEGA